MKSELAINLIQLGQFNKTVQDIDEGELWTPGLGHNHTPIWILGHLAIVGEMGQYALGGSISHRGWIRLFALGSQDPIDADRTEFTKQGLVDAINAAYEELRSLFDNASTDLLNNPHSVEIFNGTPIRTVGRLASMLLTNHFGFHLAQLSSIRRSGGHSPLI